MPRAFLFFLTIIFLQSFAHAQTDNSLCPNFSVNAVNPILKPEESIDYKVVFDKNFDTSKLTYIWTVYNGKFLKALPPSIKIQGLPENCPNTASETVSIDPAPSAWEILPCPKILLEVPEWFSELNEKHTYKLIISKDFDASKLTYLWSVKGGEILSGQGTSSIDVRLENLDEVFVEVKVGGLPENCDGLYSVTQSCHHCGVSRRITAKIDEYKKIPFDKEKTRLGNLMILLQGVPDLATFIEKSFTRTVNRANAYRDLQRILNYLESNGIEKERIFFGITFDKEERTRIYIVPPGEAFPKRDNEILNAAKLAEKLKSIKPKAKKKTAGKN